MNDSEMLRESYRKVFNPFPDDVPASEIDRTRVITDLQVFCKFTKPYEVDIAGGDIAGQLAVQEGRRTVFLRILGAMEQSRKAGPEISREGIVE